MKAIINFLNSTNLHIYMDDEEISVTEFFNFGNDTFESAEEVEEYVREILAPLSHADNFNEVVGNVCIYLDRYRK